MSTIFALASGSLPAALAIYRISGPRSIDALIGMTKRKIWKPRYMYHTKVYDKHGAWFDSAMASFFPGPGTFTGEDSAEFFVHGSYAVVNQMEKSLSSLPGLRYATAGEFSKRSLVNGKINVHEMNALGALLQSTTQRQLEQATRAYEQGNWLQHRLTHIRSKVAVLADFGEDVRSDPNEIRKDIENLLNDVKEKMKKGMAGDRVRKGIRCVLVGRPNAGKSSLFNRLCGFDRSIVSNFPGTTRDTVEMKRLIGGINVTIEDTAGIHSSTDPIEKEGIARSIHKMNEADLILAVIDASSSNEHFLPLIPTHIPSIVIYNKADLISNVLPSMEKSDVVLTSAISPIGCEALENKLEEKVLELCGNGNSELTLSAGIAEVEKLLEECLLHDDIGLTNEILQMASEAWGRCDTNEQLISNIMTNFCIGK